LVEERGVPGAEKQLLGFRELTLAPIDRNLIDVPLLTPAERQWVDNYHARVRAEIGPQLDDAARTWLAAATAPL
jgi:Xaa-Pro aminopeptidase